MFFELSRADEVEGGMAPNGIVEPVDVAANSPVGFVAGIEDGPPDELGFQGLEERFHHGVVVTIPLAGHRDQDGVLVELGLIIDRAILGRIKRSSQHLDEGVAMGTRKRRSDQAERGVLRSPGRPGVARREDRRRFWAAIAAGLASEDAACRAGVSPAVGTRWFREAGGMPPAALAPSSKPLSGRYLSFAEREEIALCRAQGQGIREVARRLGRAASTISRELRRNAATRGGGLDYRATAAQWHAERVARRPKPAKLVTNAALQTYVQDRLAGVVAISGGAAVRGPVVPWKGRRQGRRKNRQWARAWSPEQIARRVRLGLSRGEKMRIQPQAHLH